MKRGISVSFSRLLSVPGTPVMTIIAHLLPALPSSIGLIRRSFQIKATRIEVLSPSVAKPAEQYVISIQHLLIYLQEHFPSIPSNVCPRISHYYLHHIASEALVAQTLDIIYFFFRNSDAKSRIMRICAAKQTSKPGTRRDPHLFISFLKKGVIFIDTPPHTRIIFICAACTSSSRRTYRSLPHVAEGHLKVSDLYLYKTSECHSLQNRNSFRPYPSSWTTRTERNPIWCCSFCNTCPSTIPIALKHIRQALPTIRASKDAENPTVKGVTNY